MLELRQSTVADVSLGPFLDKDDAVTAETGLAGTMSVLVGKNGLAYAARSSAVAITHQTDGLYKVRLDATDTGTLGRLRVAVFNAGVHLPVWQDFNVVTQAYWDAKYGAGVLPVNATQIDGNAAAAADVVAKIGNLDAAISGLNNLDAATVKAQLVAALTTDNHAELAAVPGKDGNLASKIEWLFMLARNKRTASSLLETVNNDAGNAIATADLSDSGSVTTRGKFS